MKESLSMGQINPPADSADSTNGRMNGNEDDVGAMTAGKTSRQYRSEYRQCFRPFSQYDYVDGKFIPNAKSSTVNLAKTADASSDFGTAKDRESRLKGEPWYQEVIELRKQAKDYKCRGWGTDITPSTEDKTAIYELATKRESLSALSLAIITPTRPCGKENRKSSKGKISPSTRQSRPRTAPLIRGSGKSSRSESAHPASDSASVQLSKNRIQTDSCRPYSSRSKSIGPAHTSYRPPSAPVTSNGSKRQRPNSRPREDVVTARAISDAGRRPMSRSSSKVPSRPASAIESQIDYFREPVVKSPPEPTRVKSPEQIARSPDPINWTVPLDTAKTFSVTQSIRDEDSARQSPLPSDHSGPFDSVSGTAVNLGLIRTPSVHSNKVSSLAKEASDPQPGFTKDSTMTRPSGNSAVPAKSFDDGEAADIIKDKVNGSSTSNNTEASNMKCMEEDPCFKFDSAAVVAAAADLPPPPAKKPSYQILEDPFETIDESSAESGKRSVPPMQVLEGAREKFDKIWAPKPAASGQEEGTEA